MDRRSQTVPDIIKRFYSERIFRTPCHNLTPTSLYAGFCCWCESQGPEPLRLSEFSRLFSLLGIKKTRLCGRTCYLGITIEEERREEIQSFFAERIRPQPGASLTLPTLYEEYICWCSEKLREPLSGSGDFSATSAN